MLTKKVLSIINDLKSEYFSTQYILWDEFKAFGHTQSSFKNSAYCFEWIL